MIRKNRLGRRGLILQQNEDKIKFDLNETLYFESGQEIEEMVSISLDPDIAVQTYDSYIQIRGLIFLQGEYQKSDHVKLEEQAYNDVNFTKYIEKVVELDTDYARFSHRFPVEISVPTYRVDNLEDITVSVNSFDYELPDKNKLKLKAAIHINGINADTLETDNHTHRVDENGGLEAMKESEESPFEEMFDENEQLKSDEPVAKEEINQHTEMEASEAVEEDTAIEFESKEDDVRS